MLSFLLLLSSLLHATRLAVDVTPPPHAIYLGVVEISHRNNLRTATATVKVFADDLQSALRSAYPETFKVGPLEKLPEQNFGLISTYFAEHLRLSPIGGKPWWVQLQKITPQNDLFIVTITIRCPAEWPKLRIKADFLMELFPDQSNVLSIDNQGDKRYFRFTKDQPAQQINWE